MYVEGKCARDVTRKEEAVVKEAREPNNQSGTSRYKLGKVVSSVIIGRFSRGINWGTFCQLLVVFLFFKTHLRKGRRRREDTEERREVRVESFV